MDNWFPCMLFVRKLMLNWIHNITTIPFFLVFCGTQPPGFYFAQRDSDGSCETEKVQTFVINSTRTAIPKSLFMWLTLMLLSGHKEMSNNDTDSKGKLSVKKLWWLVSFKKSKISCSEEQPKKKKILKWSKVICGRRSDQHHHHHRRRRTQ